MIVSGSVKDATTKTPIPGAKVSLYIGAEELAVIPSDDKGEFKHSVADSYIGQTLTCQVEKQGYETQKVTHEVKQEEVHLGIIKLVPVEDGIIPVGWWERLCKWLKQNKIVVGVAVAVVVIAIFIYCFIDGKKPPPKGPDLIIESLTHSPANPTTADTITFTAVVKNIGPGKAGPSTLALKVGGETIPKTYGVPALGPGQTHPVQRKEVLPAPQRYRNTATADSKKEIRESNENNNEKTDVYQVRLKAPGVFSRGTVKIRGTWSCDLDLGKETKTDADFFWRQRTKIIRSVVPRNGAKFYVLGRRDFDSINYNNLTGLRYSSAEINGSNNASNQIPQGTVVAAITSQGRYCKFRIDTYGYNLGISWVTYSKAE